MDCRNERPSWSLTVHSSWWQRWAGSYRSTWIRRRTRFRWPCW